MPSTVGETLGDGVFGNTSELWQQNRQGVPASTVLHINIIGLLFGAVLLGATRVAFVKQATRLVTSLRINSADRDDAGTAASEKLRNPVRGLNLAQRNAQESVRPILTAGGGRAATHGVLARMRELAS